MGAAIVAFVLVLAFVSMATEPIRLDQNFPNPFANTTDIKFYIPEDGRVVLKVYNTLGQEVKLLVNEDKQIGEYRARFDGTYLPSGQYTCTMIFTSKSDGTESKLTRRMYLVR